MKKEFLHIISVVLLISFTTTVIGVNVYHHTCSKSGETEIGLDKVSCACESGDVEDSCCHSEQSENSEDSCCAEGVEHIAINSDFIIDINTNSKIFDSKELKTLDNSNLTLIEKIEVKKEFYIKKIKDIPRNILLRFIKHITNKRDSEPKNTF